MPKVEDYKEELGIDNCPYPLTKAPKGWKARVEGKKESDCPYSSMFQYMDHIYWREGWSAADKKMKELGI